MTPLEAEIIALEGEFVLGRLVRRRGNTRAGPLQVVLDGEQAGLAELLRRGRDGVERFRVRLPGDRLATTLVLLDAETGRVLIEGFDLSDHYRLRMESPVLDGLTIRGRFTIASDLGETVRVELLKDDVPVARCEARRAGRNGAGMAYRFDAALPILAELHQPYALAARPVGAAPDAAATIRVDHRQLGMIGYIETTTSEAVIGWAARIQPSRERVALDLLADGAVIATAAADRERDDLRAAGFGDGRYGFAFVIPRDGRGAAARTLGVAISGTATHLVNSPVALRPAERLRGNFDGLPGQIAIGWAADLDAPEKPLSVEIVCEGRVLATGPAQIYRADVEAAGFGLGKCGFHIDIGEAIRSCLGKPVFARIQGMESPLPGSPFLVRENPNLRRFLDRSAALNESMRARLRRRLNHRAGEGAISLIMPVHNPQRKWLAEALDSVRAQWCDNWELICIDDGSTDPQIAAVLRAYAAADRRIRVITARKNGGIARATNFGLRAARFDYVAFVDHDDYLEPDAVYRLIRAIQDSGADLLYSDEALTDRRIGSVLQVRARPAFSYDYYLSHPYFVHLVCVRTALAQRVGGWDESLPISADVDFVLRVLEKASKVAHVPSVLYRWRTHATSAGHAKQAEVMETTKSAIRRHLQRRGIAGEVRDGLAFNEFRIDWPDVPGRILVAIPTRNKHELLRACVESIERTAEGADYRIVVIDHESDDAESRAYLRRLARRHSVMPYAGKFNFAAINNAAVRRHGADAEFLLFLNNDIEALEGGWLQRLRSLAARADVGAVGPLLLYEDGTVQHAGVILGFNGGAEHAMKFAPTADHAGQRNPGYNSTLTTVRDFSAVTAACLMMRKDVFEAVGGFDEAFAIGFNDTDLCLRVRKRGLKVLYDGHTRLLHRESATRTETKEVLHPEDAARLRARWKTYFIEGDPFYNPLLDLAATDHALREDFACKRRLTMRVSEIEAPSPACGEGAG